MTELSLSSWSRGRHQLAFSYSFEDLSFSAAFWYEGADFYELEERYGAEFMQRLYFHIAAFDINKVVSLRPDRLSWGPFADFATPQFAGLWKTIFKNVWAQWRYQNDDPEYFGPSFEVSPGSAEAAPVAAEQGDVEVLAFCGGGKDSLVAMKLLERGGGRLFDSLTYSSSIYGRSQIQHELLDSLLDHGSPRHRRRLWIFDDFLESPVFQFGLDDGPKTLTAAGMPSSIFTAIPFALQIEEVVAMPQQFAAEDAAVVVLLGTDTAPVVVREQQGLRPRQRNDVQLPLADDVPRDRYVPGDTFVFSFGERMFSAGELQGFPRD